VLCRLVAWRGVSRHASGGSTVSIMQHATRAEAHTSLHSSLRLSAAGTQVPAVCIVHTSHCLPLLLCCPQALAMPCASVGSAAVSGSSS
jgi:hypothetical protein